MSRDVTRSGNGPVAVPRISPTLRKLLDRREVRASYGGDDGLTGGGDFRAGKWIAPDWVDVRERDEARAALPAYQQMAGTAPAGTVIDFLNCLWVSTKHAGDVSWDVVSKVYPRMLQQFPAWCWRPERLDQAGVSFTWFPSVAELAAFHEGERAAVQAEVDALRGVADAPTSRPPGGGKIDIEASMRRMRDKQERENAEIREKLGIPPVDVAPRLPHETDREYGKRLAHEAMRLCDEGTRALKRDVAKLQRAKLDAAREAMKPRQPEPHEPAEREAADANS